MTFPGPEVSLPEGNIPATYYGDERATAAVTSLAEQLDFELFSFNGSRQLYHSAAVISGNFSTILLHAAASILEEQGVSFQDALKMLHPLAMQSLQNAPNGPLEEVLTGPVSRSEQGIISGHIAVLQKHKPELAELYQSFINVHKSFSVKST